MSQKTSTLRTGLVRYQNCEIIELQRQVEANFVAETLDLFEREMQQITRFRRGEGLIVSNTNHVLVAIKASKTENDLITTDRKQLKEIADKKKRILKRVQIETVFDISKATSKAVSKAVSKATSKATSMVD